MGDGCGSVTLTTTYREMFAHFTIARIFLFHTTIYHILTLLSIDNAKINIKDPR